jgi:hypothetical protein
VAWLNNLRGLTRVKTAIYRFLPIPQLLLEAFELVLYPLVCKLQLGAWIVHLESRRDIFSNARESRHRTQPLVAWGGGWARSQSLQAFLHTRTVFELARKTKDGGDSGSADQSVGGTKRHHKNSTYITLEW